MEVEEIHTEVTQVKVTLNKEEFLYLVGLAGRVTGKQPEGVDRVYEQLESAAQRVGWLRKDAYSYDVGEEKIPAAHEIHSYQHTTFSRPGGRTVA